MNVVLQRLMLIAHAGIMTALLFLLSSANWDSNPNRWGQESSPKSNAFDLAKIITSPTLQEHLPLA